MTEDLGWAPVPPASLPWNKINQLILFNLATQAGPGLDMDNIPMATHDLCVYPWCKVIVAICRPGSDAPSLICP